MPQPADPSNYTVVARRYRPQRFEDVVGQDNVVESLRNAIKLNRVTHAYLFSGTRGVGKTSIARIFAKCLNCVKGPTDQPCLQCDICQAIATGEDVDVLEIDGASNNGVESVRELRQNTGLRPSRSRFKIYYIDEVHMLSTGAFNALLKTLEEPPPHVKFFFATTEPGKIPVTVLSRCQRYDFAGITPEQIVATLSDICVREQIEAEPEALQTIARRAGGSMRDAQSLVEQLLSSAGERLTVEAVHRLLGTASDERILDVVDALADHDSGAILQLVDAAANQGIQPTDLLNGVIDFLRDVMVLSAGADQTVLTATPRQRPRLQAVVDRWPLDSILAALQILPETRSRLRGSSHGRTIIEVGLVKVARLENLAEISDLVGRLIALEGGLPPMDPAQTLVKKKLAPPDPEPSPPLTARGEPARTADSVPTPALTSTSSPPPPPASRTELAPAPRAHSAAPLVLSEVVAIWPQVVQKVGLGLGKGLSQVVPTAISEPDVLVIGVPPRYNWIVEDCGTPQSLAKIEEALASVLNRPVQLRFERSSKEVASATPTAVTEPNRHDEVSDDPMVRKVVELFEARPVLMEAEEDLTRSSNA
ncbi:DNA polymerase-3 subunit gamma/tau [Singulisphaera sp. GP187]|uniref:DNA polymerase III subunit gamma/tau n=1 Tax=Singulisphaera sp. GP187 TaxID=1882752 RepID=UPI000928D6F2|nr:DNA polymerase III subunit gamma/tau [Singulisphaera sp. GP187]SIO65754.1 DNA polymerase-3 subunit gamma/tau [Singulisphaera sp. GP187]